MNAVPETPKIGGITELDRTSGQKEYAPGAVLMIPAGSNFPFARSPGARCNGCTFDGGQVPGAPFGYDWVVVCSPALVLTQSSTGFP